MNHSTPWDQRIARVLVRPLVNSPVTPNQLTFVTLLLALVGSVLLAFPEWVGWGAGLFILARFLDHFDGELARQSGKASELGYYLDYISGGLSYGALFLCMGLGFVGTMGVYAVLLGLAGTASALISVALNLKLDQAAEFQDGETVGYPGWLGFELEDGIYLLGPVVWLGWLQPFFVAAGIGAAIYTLWTLARLIRTRGR